MIRRRMLLGLSVVFGSSLILAASLCVIALRIDTGGLESPLAEAGNAVIHDIASETEAWSVIVLADVQGGFAYLPEIFRRAAPERPRAVFMLGDLSSRPDEEHLSLAVWTMKRHPPPAALFVVPGNHDVERDAGVLPFRRWFGALTFDVRIGGVRFIGLNNADGPLDDATLRELQGRLDSFPERVVLCLHREIIDWEGKRGQKVEERNRALLDLIQAAKPAMILSGHHHQSHDEIRGSTRFIVAPPSGDRSRDTGSIPVSFLVLRCTGRELEIETRRFERSTSLEVKGAFLHVALAHVRPFFGRRPIAAYALLVFGIAAGIAAWTYVIRRVRTAPFSSAASSG